MVNYGVNSLKNISIILLLCFAISLNGCGYKTQNNVTNLNQSTKKMEARKDVELNIVTTDKLLYNMVESISKNIHCTEYMFKNRDTELNFQFTDDSLNNISKKDLLIYMGAGFEPWMNDFIDKLSKNKVGITNVSRGVKLLEYNKEVKYKNYMLTDNPYYLMNPDNYKIALLNIKNSIQDKDPKNRDSYQKNFSEEIKSIEGYQKDLKEIKDKIKQYNFIVAEEEMNYFIKYNDLNSTYINKDTSGKWDLESKIKDISDTKHIVLLYNSPYILKENEDIIKKYNIKSVNIKVYTGEENYKDIIKYDILSLKKFYEGESSSK